ncbi:MAG: hypothetical protein HYY18_09520 [Planctomycetes bacterium]|nr:hypothetical protein [Planctomycetota bacterium]
MNRAFLFSMLLLAACDRPPAPAPPAPAAPAPMDVARPPRVEPPAPKPAPERRVRLEVTATAWHKGKPFAIEQDLRAKLERVGVEAVAGGEGKDGVVEVTYEEKKGRAYRDEGSREILDATDIVFKLSVRAPKTGQVLLLLEADSELTDVVTGDLTAVARASFQRSRAYEFAGPMVAVALGVRSAAPALLAAIQWEDTREDALRLLAGIGFKPSAAADRAIWAISSGRFADCVDIGPDAAPFLVEYIRGLQGDSEQMGFIAEGGGISGALDALGRVGGPVAQRFLSDLLEKDGKCFGSGHETRLATIDAVGNGGVASDLPILDWIAKRGETTRDDDDFVDQFRELGDSARKAAAAIRRRASAEPR